MPPSLLLLIVLILLLVGVFPTWGRTRAWGAAPSAAVGLAVLVLVVLVLLGKI